jgi:hypothetical protein
MLSCRRTPTRSCSRPSPYHSAAPSRPRCPSPWRADHPARAAHRWAPGRVRSGKPVLCSAARSFGVTASQLFARAVITVSHASSFWSRSLDLLLPGDLRRVHRRLGGRPGHPARSAPAHPSARGWVAGSSHCRSSRRCGPRPASLSGTVFFRQLQLEFGHGLVPRFGLVG